MNPDSPDRQIKAKRVAMGRTEATVVKPPPAFRRDARAKRARATINKVIPALLSAHPRARKGIDRSELIVDPPPFLSTQDDEVERGHEKEILEGAAGSKEEGLSRGGKKKKQKKQKRTTSREEQHDSLENADEKRIGRNEKNNSSHNKSARHANSPRITLCVADTLEAAHALLQPEPLLPRSSSPSSSYSSFNPQRQEKSHDTISESAPKSHSQSNPKRIKVGILNMASPLSPGGGFLNGATSQEESLCMRTTLLPSLRDEFYRLPELGVVYTPDVLVFRSPTSSSYTSRNTDSSESNNNIVKEAGSDPSNANSKDKDKDKDMLPKQSRYFIDVATAAMLRLPDTTSDNKRYANLSDRVLAERKMRAVLRVFTARGCTRVVLGAWGCGAYGNPVGEIAEAWRRVILGVGVGTDAIRRHRDTERRGNDGDGGGTITQNQTGEETGGMEGDGDGEERESSKKKDEGEGTTSRDGEKSNNGNGNYRGKNRVKEPKNETEPWGRIIEEIVFAINDMNLATAFARAFGEDILPLPLPSPSPSPRTAAISSNSNSNTTDDPTETARVTELRAKIAELEIQVSQARSEQLRAGLQSVLAGLRRQLPAEDQGSDNNSDNDQEAADSEDDHFGVSSQDKDDDEDCDG